MDLTLSPGDLALQRTARAFADRPTPEKCWRDVLSYLHGFGTNEAVKLKCFPLIPLDGEMGW